jgi:hypothetical protein
MLRTVMLVLYLIYGLLSVVQILYAHHMIPRMSWLRGILQFSINQGNVFLYAAMALALVIVVLSFVSQRRSLRLGIHGVDGADGENRVSGADGADGLGNTDDADGADRAAAVAPKPAATSKPATEPKAATDTATNPALRRKARAAWRTTRRWGTVVVVGFALVVFSLTAVKAYSEREVELTPAEPMQYVGSNIQIPLESIDDGHLHRFAHITEKGTEVRFIIIKKNEVAYGVGLDACNVCGATGYYERDDEVVCKMCDVVMNKQTIGFPGGCNPIPLEFTIADGVFSVEVALLEQEAGRFE